MPSGTRYTPGTKASHPSFRDLRGWGASYSPSILVPRGHPELDSVTQGLVFLSQMQSPRGLWGHLPTPTYGEPGAMGP